MAYTLATIHQTPQVRISDSTEAWLSPHTLRHLSRREKSHLQRELARDPYADTIVLAVSAQSARRMQGEHKR